MGSFNIKPSTVRTTLLLSAGFLLLAMLQTTFFPLFPIFGVTPDLFIAALVTIALFEGERTGGVAGVAAGFFIECVGGHGLALLPLFYMLTGYLAGVLFNRMLKKDFPSAMILCLVGYALKIAVTVINVRAANPDCGVGTALLRVAFPEFFASLVSAPIVFLLFFLISKIFRRAREIES